MTKPKVTYLCLSDVHLNHPRTTTRKIVDNLAKYFDEFAPTSRFAKLDVIFLPGDLFDKLMDCSNASFYDSMEFLTRLVDFCERHRIKLRISEGTPSHDWNQSKLLDMVANLRKTKADVKWIPKLQLEYMSDLDLHVLYIPDEHSSSAEKTLKDVKALMLTAGLTQVDVTMMHGMFGYQMAGIPGKHDCHSEQEYLALTKHYINIGHVHIFSSYERIIAQGSFDRLAHGEEHPKGAVVCTIRSTVGDSFEFVENKDAAIYKTVQLKDDSLEKSITYLDRLVGSLPMDSHVRIKARQLHPAYQAFSTIKLRYPHLNMTKLSLEDEKEHKNALEPVDESYYDSIEITSSNVVDLLMKEVGQLTSLEAKDSAELNTLLSAIV